MAQLDLVEQIERQAFEVDRRCGTCVVWNGLNTAPAGDCSVHGRRGTHDPACEGWFSRWELLQPSYGRR